MKEKDEVQLLYPVPSSARSSNGRIPYFECGDTGSNPVRASSYMDVT